METSSFQNVACFKIPVNGQSPRSPLILSHIHHHYNPFASGSHVFTVYAPSHLLHLQLPTYQGSHESWLKLQCIQM
jgi:hypothetical protein